MWEALQPCHLQTSQAFQTLQTFQTLQKFHPKEGFKEVSCVVGLGSAPRMMDSDAPLSARGAERPCLKLP